MLVQAQRKQKKKRAQEKQMIEVFKQNQARILHCTSSNDAEPAEGLEGIIRRLKQRVAELEQQNSALQAALCSKIFEKGL